MAASKKGSVNIAVEEGFPKDHISFKEAGYGERHFVRKGEAYDEVTKPLQEPVRVHRDRCYAVNDSDSFVRYIGVYGDEGKGIIFCGNNQLVMFFNEASRAERVVLPFQPSLELKSFLGDGPKKTFTQKAFAKVLETFPDAVEGQKLLLPCVERLKIETQVEFESSIDETDHVFFYREKDGTQTARIPKQITLGIPFFERSKNTVLITADLEITRPKSADEKPVFILTNPRHERTHREAIEAEVEGIRNELKNWMFVWGSPEVVNVPVWGVASGKISD